MAIEDTFITRIKVNQIMRQAPSTSSRCLASYRLLVSFCRNKKQLNLYITCIKSHNHWVESDSSHMIVAMTFNQLTDSVLTHHVYILLHRWIHLQLFFQSVDLVVTRGQFFWNKRILFNLNPMIDCMQTHCSHTNILSLSGGKWKRLEHCQQQKDPILHCRVLITKSKQCRNWIHLLW